MSSPQSIQMQPQGREPMVAVPLSEEEQQRAAQAVRFDRHQ